MNAVDATSRAVEEDTGAPPSLLTVVLFPATFALVWLLLPLREHRAMLPAGADGQGCPT